MNYLKISTLLFLSLLTSTISFGQWTDISPSGGNPDEIIYDIYFSSDNNGIAVGTNPGTYEGLVYTTTDGGATWSRETFINTAWRSIHFSDRNNGVIAGRQSDPSNTFTTMFLHTSDGGRTWTKSTGQDNGITAVSFVSPQVGYSIGGGPNQGDAAVQKTTDGGKTWSTTWSTYGWFINSIYFLDENTGFIAGGTFLGSFDAILAKTTDGGKTFTEITYDKESNASGLYFTSAQVGYVLDRTMQSSRKLSKTTDGGQTWTKLADLDKDVHLLVFAGDDVAIAAGGNGEAYQSTDGGQNWSAAPITGVSKTIRNVRVYGKFVYIMGQNPFIKKMEHNGTNGTYTSIEKNIQPTLNTEVVLYPNPARGNSIVQFEGLEGEEIDLMLINATGQVVFQTQIQDAQVDLNQAQLPRGVYFYQLRTASEIASGKLIVE